MSPMDRDRVRRYLAARVPNANDIEIARLERTGGGASRETWLVDAEWTEDDVRALHPLIIRRDPTASVLESDRRREFEVIRAARQIPVPVPQTYWLEEDPQWLDRSFMVMERLPGIAPPVLFPPGESAEVRRVIAQEFVTYLARIHRADWRRLGFEFLGVPGVGEAVAQNELESCDRGARRASRPADAGTHRDRRSAPARGARGIS